MSGANITAILYGGNLCLNFQCRYVTCEHYTCDSATDEDPEKCYFRERGECRNGAEQLAALKALRDRLTRKLRQLPRGEE